MSALVWSVEGVLIGLWALVFVQFAPTPFHTFVARAQLAVAGATLVMQLVASARVLPVAHAISEAYVCAVSGLFLVYVMVLLDPGHYANPKFFSMGAAGGLLPVDACVGIGWFSAALVGGIGMALSERGRPSALMLHHYGYHMLIVPPSFLVFWLYNYDGTSTTEPLSLTVQFLRQGARITHFIYTMLLVGIWGAYIVLQATGAPATEESARLLRNVCSRGPALRVLGAAEAPGAMRVHFDPAVGRVHRQDHVADAPRVGAGGHRRGQRVRLAADPRAPV